MVMWPQTHKLKRIAFSICWQLPVVSVECIWFVDYLWIITIYHLISLLAHFLYLYGYTHTHILRTCSFRSLLINSFESSKPFSFSMTYVCGCVRVCFFGHCSTLPLLVFFCSFSVFSGCAFICAYTISVCVHIIISLVGRNECAIYVIAMNGQASLKLKTWKENVREQSRLIKYSRQTPGQPITLEVYTCNT